MDETYNLLTSVNKKQVKIIIGQRQMPKRFHIHLALFKLITWA
jgi:hypothetical protein